MPTIDDIATAALRRLEEDTVSPVFWNYPEMRSLVLEALCEAILITGSPQVRITSAPYTLVANQTFQPAPQVVFANHSVLAIVRIEGTGNLALHKCSLFDLDMDNKDWRNDLQQRFVWKNKSPLGHGVNVPAESQSFQLLEKAR